MISLTTPVADQLWMMQRYGVDPRYYGRAAMRVGIAAALEPLSRIEKQWFRRLAERTPLIQDPIFILGFGRSGTTHLHNLLCQDSRFGYVSNYQALAHPVSVLGKQWLPKMMSYMTPETRPMDNVAVSPELPQEEEIAIANHGRHAPLHFMSFPRYASEIFDPYVFFDALDEERIQAWSEGFLETVNKASILSDGKQLVLKTPTNTARIPLLLHLFPKAKFVYIHRCPYAVYRSMLNMYEKILPGETLQDIDWAQVETSVVRNYQLTIGRYLEHRHLIPDDNLVEITFEALEVEPLEQIRMLYDQLELPDFAETEQDVVAYLATLSDYTKNNFAYAPELIERVNAAWEIGFEPFGYATETASKGPGV